MIHLPASITTAEKKKNYGKFTIEGLYPGYGVTIGNALRRVLLSSIEGAAVTSFKIKGVYHEFSTIPNIQENVLDIMLNLKQLRVKLYGDEPQILKLRVQGEKTVTGKDFESNPMAEIMNPELVIANITDKKGKLELEATIERGLGYSQVEERKGGRVSIGTIAVDAIFSPIQKVNFQVEDMRVGEKTNYNRLMIDIETDGSISPEQALAQAAMILKDHFKLIEEKFSFSEDKETPKLEKDAFKKGKKTPKDILIEDLDLSQRTKKALINNGIKTLAGLLRYREETLLELEGLGEKSLEEVKEVIKDLEYTLK
ncbi:MAG: DNA-directed RNA polymerase subunit alpha [Candidatus Pacebacteria bacterium]|nr:DNA-directed RNA polymerase subunit alpha [Candidatus Paceibacterota bacterium]